MTTQATMATTTELRREAEELQEAFAELAARFGDLVLQAPAGALASWRVEGFAGASAFYGVRAAARSIDGWLDEVATILARREA